MAAARINYTNPSGFLEFLPGEKRLEQHLIDTIRSVFERYGYTPIETPAVERMEVLQAKGNQGDNILYRIEPVLPEQDAESGKGDSGSESRGLKFDQTVPLAAYIARHLNDLTFPFARYQMDPIFRGERAQAGRYRQFRQCDIDVVGRGELPLLYDAQVAAIITEIFDAVGIGDYKLRINNRKVLTGFFEACGVAESDIRRCTAIIDAAEKVGPEKTRASLEALGLTPEAITRMLEFGKIEGSSDTILTQLEAMDLGGTFNEGVADLKAVASAMTDLGVPANRWTIDLSIARGLNYYTGTVYETTLVGHENLGSVCSGGRYDDLVGMFVGEPMPGVGISIGLTRLLVKLLELDILQPLAATPSQVAVIPMAEEQIPFAMRVSHTLRKAGINTETTLKSQKFKKLIGLASKRQIPLVAIIGGDEAAANRCQLKDMTNGEQTEVPIDDLVETVRARLATHEGHH